VDGKPAPLDDPLAFMEWLVEQAGSQAELGRLSGLLPSTVSDYVRGENEPKLTNVLKMMRAVEALLQGAPPQEEVRLREAHAAEVERFRRLNDRLEAELARPPRAGTQPA
jgi:transcriptional regulator with XRE-family HTH domain